MNYIIDLINKKKVNWMFNLVIPAMVDPASVDIHINKVGPTLMGQTTSKKKKGQDN